MKAPIAFMLAGSPRGYVCRRIGEQIGTQSKVNVFINSPRRHWNHWRRNHTKHTRGYMISFEVTSNSPMVLDVRGLVSCPCPFSHKITAKTEITSSC